MESETNERHPTMVDSGWRREDILDAIFSKFCLGK